MKRIMWLVLSVALAIGMFIAPASAQVVPTSVDPFELAPQNVHLYPLTLDARLPFYYLPPIFAPAPMWRGSMDAAMVRSFTPHNYVAYEIPESTALVAWGKLKGDKQLVMEAANQQEFLILPPESIDDGGSFFSFRTTMRMIPDNQKGEFDEYLEHELVLPSSRVASIADEIPIALLLYEYDRVSDVADIQPRVNEALLGGIKNADGLATMKFPVERIYISYSGWRRNPNRMRSAGQEVPEWLTIEGKIVALKEYDGDTYMLSVYFEGYNPWYPIETAKNVIRKMIALSFNEFIETTNYIDFEKPLSGKEWHRQGSGRMFPFDTRRRVGTGESNSGGY